MKKLLVVFAIVTISCKSNKQPFQPIADAAAKYFKVEAYKFEKLETIYLAIDTINEVKKYEILIDVCNNVMKSHTHDAGFKDDDGTQIYITDNPDLMNILNTKRDSLFKLYKKADSSKILAYKVNTFVVYNKTNGEQICANKYMYYDTNFKLIHKQLIFGTDSIEDSIKYQPITNELVDTLAKKYSRFSY